MTENSQVPLTRNPKLTKDQVMKMLVWIAEFKSTRDVKNLVKEKFGVSLHEMTVNYYKHSEKWQPMIRKFREQWGQDIMHIPLVHKRKRLEELEKIYLNTFGQEDYKLSLEALEKIKHETEKDLQNLHLYNIKVYKNMSNEELESERLKTLEEIKKLKEMSHASEIGETTENDGDITLIENRNEN